MDDGDIQQQNAQLFNSLGKCKHQFKNNKLINVFKVYNIFEC